MEVVSCSSYALKKVVKCGQIISDNQVILFSHVRHQLHSHICNKAGNDRGNLLTHQENNNYYFQRPSQPLSFRFILS